MKRVIIITGGLCIWLMASSCSRMGFEPSPAPQPYPYVSGHFSGETVEESPDPLVSYRWKDPRATDGLEVYNLDLYFLDWDGSGRRSGIELFDLDSKELLAPVKIVRNYRDGRYMIYRTNRSVRFRINHVRGPNASLSALFFDSPNE